MAIRFDAFGIIVDNMAASLAFYRLVGVDIADGAEDESHVEAFLPGGIRMMFDTVELVRGFNVWEPPVGGHRIGLAFLCETPEAVDEMHVTLVRAGHRSHLAPFDAPWGQRYATVLDPDGNPVDLFAPRA
jgi:catechol 2,3-dioxygenase-like lactoylglutathione lyase family enzyme